MRVGFDARMIDHPGIGRYIANLLNAMFEQAGRDEFVLFGDSKMLSTIDYGPSTVDIIEYNARIYGWAESFFDPFEKANLDIMHVPHFNVPILERTNKLVVTIHDLIYLKFTESVPDFMQGIAVRYVISNAVKKADKIIAVSENTKKDIIEHFPAATGKVEVIHEAADPIFAKIDDEGKKEGIRKKYNLPPAIILYVGSLKKHKNIERLIDAYIDLKSKGIRHKLVIVGRYRPKEAQVLKKIQSSDALYLGEVPTDDLALIYNLASLLVMPSLYEGFGLPALEAMASGVPVAASSVASLPEVIGDAGILLDPEDISNISEVIYKGLVDDDLRRELIRKGLERVKEFSWKKTAQQTLQLYEDTVRS